MEDQLREELTKIKFFYQTESESQDLIIFLEKFKTLHTTIIENISVIQNSLVQMNSDVSALSASLNPNTPFSNAIMLNKGLMVSIKRLGELLVLVAEMQALLNKVYAEHQSTMDQIESIQTLLKAPVEN